MTTEASKEKLVADLKVLIGDTEEMLRATAGQAGDKVNAARERLQASVAAAKIKLGEAEEALRERGKQAAESAEEYVREHPWPALGMAAAVGFLVGALLNRR